MIERQTDIIREMDRWTKRDKKNNDVYKQTEKRAETQMDMQTEKKTDRFFMIDRQTNWRLDGEIGRQG